MKNPKILILLLIIIAGGLLRSADIGISYFDDEPDFMVQVNSMDLNSGHIPLAAVGHSPLSLYITKISGSLFGSNPVGHRTILLIINILLIYLIYQLARPALSQKEGLIAAFLASINCFIIYYSREIGCDGFFLFFETLIIYYFYQASTTRKNKDIILCGLFTGLGLLNKTTTIFLLPAMFIYLIISPRRRQWFKRSSLYLSITLGLLIVSPYLCWLYQNQWSHFVINSRYIEMFNWPPMSAILFFGDLGLHSSFYPHPMSFGREYMSGLMGLILVTGVVSTIHKARNNDFIMLLQLLFWSVIIISLTIFQGWSVHYNICMIPTLLLTAHAIKGVWDLKIKPVRVIIIILLSIPLANLPAGLKKIKTAYNVHSTILESNFFPSGASINEISNALIPLMESYRPTLVVTPNREWDTIACYLEANTGIRTLAPIPLVYDSVKFNKNQFNRVLILDSALKTPPDHKWQEQYLKRAVSTKTESISFMFNNRPNNRYIIASLLTPKSKSNTDRNDLEQFVKQLVRNNYPQQ